MKRKIWMPVVLLTAMLCIPVMAEDESVWTFDTDNYSLDGYSGAGGDVVVPDTISGCPVDIIGMSAFSSSDTITSLTLPETVKQLEESAGGWCSALTEVSLPQSLLVIGQNCFASDGSLEQVTIPSQVCYIDTGAFGFCQNLKSVTFEGECPVIGKEVLTNISDDAVIYVPDDQVDAYTGALADAGCTASVQPSGQNAVASDPVCDTENLVFDASTGTITAYTGYNVRLDIPETIDGVQVTAIGDNGFTGHRYLCYLTLPEGLTSIGNEAFMNASTLMHVEFPSTLTTIGDRAFCRSFRGTVLDLPEGLEYIGEEAFVYATIRGDLTLPDGVQTIGSRAFYQLPWVTGLYLPSSVESIGSQAFADSSISYLAFDFHELIDIASDAFSGCPASDLDLPWDSSFENRDAYAEVMAEQCPDCTVWINNPVSGGVAQYPSNDLSILSITEGVWTAYYGDTADLTVWTEYDDYEVTAIGDGLFKGSQTIRSFYPHHCGWFTTIGNEAFADSSVEYVELFGSITTIGEGSFRNCVNMKELTIPASVTSIGSGAFEGCQGLEKVTVLCDAALLGEGAFAGCPNLTEVYVEKGDIPADCFADSALATVTLGDEVTSVGDRAFANTKITEINLISLTGIGASAFENTLLTKATFSGLLTSIGDNAFAGTGITNIVIPAELEVNPAAFAGIPSEGIRINDYASDEQLAAWNEALSTPWYAPLTRESDEISFVKMPFVPTSEEYFEIDASTGTITFYTGNDVDVVIPRTIDGVEVKSIGYGAFSRAEDYTDVDMDTNQEDWLHLRSVVIPETVTSISDSAFNYCQQLETVICYGPLETTGKGTFHFCRSLENVVFVNGVKVLDNYLFEFCESLKNVWYKGQLDLIGEDCFRGCGLESFVINAKQVGSVAFRECTSLKEIHVRDGIEDFSKGAFQGCTSLSDICFEFSSAGVFDDGDVYTGDCAPDARMRIPSSASDEDAAQFYNIWKKGNLGPIADEEHIIREDCTVPDPEKPDVKELMAAFDVTCDSSMEEVQIPAASSPETEEAPVQNTAGQPQAAASGDAGENTEPSPTAEPDESTEPTPAENDPEPVPENNQTEIAAGMDSYLERKFICRTADVSGYTMDASALGAEYSVTFHSGGQTDFVLAGTTISTLTWSLEKVQTDSGEADAFVIVYFDGTPLNFVITEAGFDLNFYDSMLMHFEPEA